VGWALGFAFLFVLLWQVNTVLSPFFEIVPNRVSLVFLPAFVRVVAVVVAGGAGVAGIFLGSFFVGFVLVGDPISLAMPNALSSALAPVLAYWLLRRIGTSDFIRGNGLTWSSFMVLTVLCGLMNALVHGAVWSGQTSMSQNLVSLVSMVIGDLVGVALGLSLLRLLTLVCPACMRRLLTWLATRAATAGRVS
jgi:MFS superfamily sulfate permease-like transporter